MCVVAVSMDLCKVRHVHQRSQTTHADVAVKVRCERRLIGIGHQTRHAIWYALALHIGEGVACTVLCDVISRGFWFCMTHHTVASVLLVLSCVRILGSFGCECTHASGGW